MHSIHKMRPIDRWISVVCLSVCLSVCVFVIHTCRQARCGYISYCLFVYLYFVRLRISPPKIKLAVSNVARRFFGVQNSESFILGNFDSQKPKIGRIGQRANHAHPHVSNTVEMHRHKHHDRDAPFVKSRGVWTQDRHLWIYVSPSDVNSCVSVGHIRESCKNGLNDRDAVFEADS